MDVNTKYTNCYVQILIPNNLFFCKGQVDGTRLHAPKGRLPCYSTCFGRVVRQSHRPRYQPSPCTPFGEGARIVWTQKWRRRLAGIKHEN